jgi:hypothetical protein
VNQPAGQTHKYLEELVLTRLELSKLTSQLETVESP